MTEPNLSFDERPSRLEAAFGVIAPRLDLTAARGIQVKVNGIGIEVRALTEYGQRQYTWNELNRALRAERYGHRTPSWLLAAPLTRWTALLPFIGHLLDARGVRYCVLAARVAPSDAPSECEVDVSTGGRTVLDAEEVRWRLLQQRERREPPQGSRALRPWWALWRRDEPC
jgi:hypothetical protein